MVKIILCILIIIAGIAAGHLKARTYENRVLHLQDLITTIKILESEMKYRLDPLPEIFIKISGMKISLAGRLFETTSRLLREDFAHDFANCWNQAVELVYKDSSLTRADKQVLSDLGIELGKTDMGSQYSLFSRAYTLLDAQVAEAAEEKRTKGKMYKSLGTAVGVLVVILLV
ncbi:stage III sporulation protein AB [Sinanaerobacter chloroacetimidivorans]|jgi:stage III sporulation protein AB|uniref:Stage III sporulation protein AB n=1 Tax=Sinanaerobacter chloroacetimidivorans TaxID=2818044 RepID=A0A8J7VZT6_9FIRM|nr:stage III sporulation protein AB [Sinanaerobacter chloroacetimidivorans]MBR0596640.1 stage III sporulation protein AB [Sinanaerobacter chloroacetimidivorans]